MDVELHVLTDVLEYVWDVLIHAMGVVADVMAAQKHVWAVPDVKAVLVHVLMNVVEHV